MMAIIHLILFPNWVEQSEFFHSEVKIKPRLVNIWRDLTWKYRLQMDYKDSL